VTFLNDLATAWQNLTQPASLAQGQQPAKPSVLTLQLFENIQVKLDGSGNGSAKLTPYGARNSGLTWDVDAVAVSVSTNVNEAVCSVYISYGNIQADATTLVGTTTTGSTGDTCGVGQTIRPNDFIIVKWTGGDANQIATARITGTVNPQGVS